MKKLIICLILILYDKSFSQKLIYGNLSSHIDSALSTITIDTFHIKQVSTDSITQNILTSTIESILKYEYKYAIMKADSMGYHIIRLVDTTTFPGKSYFLFERKTEYNKYYGIYIFNSNPQSPRTIFQHSSKNEGNDLFGKSIYIFVKSQARAIFFPPKYPDPVKFNKNLFQIIHNVSKLEKRDVFFFQIEYFTKPVTNSDIIIKALFSNSEMTKYLSELNEIITSYNNNYKLKIYTNSYESYYQYNINTDNKIVYPDGSIYYPQNKFIDISFENKNFTDNNKNLDNIIEPITENISEYKDNIVLPFEPNIRFGFRTDLTAFYEKHYGINYKNQFNMYFYPLPVSLYFYSRIELTNNFTLELRPGLLIADDDLSGLEFGLLCNWYLINKEVYLIGGFNTHFTDRSFTMLREGSGMWAPIIQFNRNNQMSIGIGIGEYISEKISTDICIFKTLTEKYATVTPTYVMSSDYMKKYPEYLYFYIKIGFNFTF